MATLIDPGRIGVARLFSDQYGGNPSSVAFGQALVSGGGWQYAAWYAPSGAVQLARRAVGGAAWETITLPFGLLVNDSHNSINLGVSTADGRLHVAAGQHNDPVQYTWAPVDAAWDASSFAPVSAELMGTPVGDMTYPTLTAAPDGRLLFWYRNGGPSNGRMRLAEYAGGAWALLGDVSSSTGSWTAPNGGVSTSRNLYWAHPVYDGAGRLHLAGTWRESSASVLCSPGMISNHHVVYVYSDDHGRTWRNTAGAAVATTGTDPIAVSDPVHIPSFASTNLAHQVSDLAIGPGGRVGILPDYVDPGLLTNSPKCVVSMDQRFSLAGQGPRWLEGGLWDAEMVRLAGTVVKTGYPSGRKACTRGRMAFSPAADMVVIFSGLRILSARAITDYADWTLDEDGANTAYAFGELGGVDRAREPEGLLSVLYMQRDGVVCVRDILL